MKENTEVVRQAAQSGMDVPEFKGHIVPIIKEEVTPRVSDAALMDEEEAVKEVTANQRGAAWIQPYLNAVGQLAPGWRAEKGAIAKKVEESMAKADAAALDKVDKKRQMGPKGLIAGLKVLPIAVISVGALLGETHLLVNPIANYLGETAATAQAVLWLASIAAVLLTVFGLLAEDMICETEPRRVRIIAGCLGGFSLLIGYLRTAQCDITGVFNTVILYVLWSGITFAVPIACARLIRILIDNLFIWLTYVSEMRACNEIICHYAGISAQYRAGMELIEGKIEDYISTPQRVEEREAEERQSARFLVRTTNRQIEGAEARHIVRFKHERSKKPWGLLTWLAIGAGVVLLSLFVGPAFAGTRIESSHIVVMCDRSISSKGGLACSSKKINELFSKWIEEAIERPGSTFSLNVLGQDAYDVVEVVSIEVPKIKAPLRENKRKWRAERFKEIGELDLPTLKNASGIVEGIYEGASKLAGATGRKTLVVMSDMRQVSRGSGFNFEHNIPAPEKFVAWLQSMPSKPKLLGRIIICGFHPRGQGISLRKKLEIEVVWMAALQYWGVKNTEISEECRF